MHSEIASGIVAVPTRPLMDVLPEDKLVACSVGPIAFEIPLEVTSSYEVHRVIGGVCFVFYSKQNNRQAVIEIPTIRLEETSIGDIGNPTYSQLSFPKFHKMVVEEQSSDFSWFMTPARLRDHIFLLEYRAAISDDTSLLEYLWREDLEAVLTHSNVTTFSWTALDDQLSGMVIFSAANPSDTDWIQHFCATFEIDGNPLQIGQMEDSEIKSLVTLTEVSTR